MATKIALYVVLFSDLKNWVVPFSFTNFSYGDADYTIVNAVSLVAELDEREGEWVFDGDVQALRDELADLGDCLIAFTC